MEALREPILRLVIDGDDLNLVQVTDLHLAFRYAFKRTHLRRLRRVVRSAHPDLLVNTGDLFCRRRASPLPLVDQYMAYIGAEWPWAFSWGNHDHELLSEHLEAVEEYLDACPRIVYTKAHEFFSSRIRLAAERSAAEGTFLGGNYAIEVIDRNGASDRPSWLIYIFNSGRDTHIPWVVLTWARELSARYGYSVPSVRFMHRPVCAMKDAAESGSLQGFAHETVSAGDDSRSVHELRAIRTVKACFLGHDHSNNFICDVDGIRYHSSRKSLSLSYGARSVENFILRKNGGRTGIHWGITKIALSMGRGSLSVETILEDGTVFQPFSVP